MELRFCSIAPERYLKVLTALIVVTFVNYSFSQKQEQSVFRIDVKGVQVNKGKVFVSVFNKEEQWLETPYRTMVLTSEDAIKSAEFNLPPGKYAISMFQDINQNDELDRSWIGKPKEPVGFGNNYEPFGPPRFSSATVTHEAGGSTHSIKLKTL